MYAEYIKSLPNLTHTVAGQASVSKSSFVADHRGSAGNRVSGVPAQIKPIQSNWTLQTCGKWREPTGSDPYLAA
ncbi:hypothetical protein VI817_008009 [Penicillium citrinum]|nr:hypothetical protein VI817_008009 [Penicillium citrinum]